MRDHEAESGREGGVVDVPKVAERGISEERFAFLVAEKNRLEREIRDLDAQLAAIYEEERREVDSLSPDLPTSADDNASSGRVTSKEARNVPQPRLKVGSLVLHALATVHPTPMAANRLTAQIRETIASQRQWPETAILQSIRDLRTAGFLRAVGFEMYALTPKGENRVRREEDTQGRGGGTNR